MNSNQIDKNRLYLILVIALVALFFMYRWGAGNKADFQEQESLNSVLADTLLNYKGKDGENRARISQFQTDKVSDFLKLKTKDEEVIYLQSQVKKYKKELGNSGSVTVVESEGDYAVTVPTVVKPTADPKFPTYEGDSKDKFGDWAHITSVSNKDSTSYTLKTKDKFTLVLGSEPTGFLGLGKRKPFADVTNENPYSTTKKLRSYEVTPERKGRFKVTAGGMGGFTFLNGQTGWGATLGIGVGYELFNF